MGSIIIEETLADYSEALEHLEQAVAFGDYEDLARGAEELENASAELQKLERQVRAEALNRMVDLARHAEQDGSIR